MHAFSILFSFVAAATAVSALDYDVVAAISDPLNAANPIAYPNDDSPCCSNPESLSGSSFCGSQFTIGSDSNLTFAGCGSGALSPPTQLLQADVVVATCSNYTTNWMCNGCSSPSSTYYKGVVICS
ncbi:MAG: hypothetical protein M1819_000448 [Sarea resinae]|nr:MAG: hypothetical protein M1819_000448 [Sarea resinae]